MPFKDLALVPVHLRVAACSQAGDTGSDNDK